MRWLSIVQNWPLIINCFTFLTLYPKNGIWMDEMTLDCTLLTLYARHLEFAQEISALWSPIVAMRRKYPPDDSRLMSWDNQLCIATKRKRRMVSAKYFIKTHKPFEYKQGVNPPPKPSSLKYPPSREKNVTKMSLRCELRPFADTYISKFSPAGRVGGGPPGRPPAPPCLRRGKNFLPHTAVSRRDFKRGASIDSPLLSVLIRK